MNTKLQGAITFLKEFCSQNSVVVKHKRPTDRVLIVTTEDGKKASVGVDLAGDRDLWLVLHHGVDVYVTGVGAHFRSAPDHGSCVVLVIGVGEGLVWDAVGAEHPHLIGQPQLIKRVAAVSEDGQVRSAAHDDANPRCHGPRLAH